MFGRVGIAATVVLAGCTSFGTDPPIDAEGGALTNDASLANGQVEAAAGDAALDGAGKNDGGVILDGAAWSSPNAASWSVTPQGTTITSYGATHPLIVWTGSSAVAGDDYTVAATVLSPVDDSTREFGLFVRGTVDGGTVFGSAYGRAAKTFLAGMRPPAWEPTNVALGATYTYVPLTRFGLKVKVVGRTVRGKLWNASAVEPSGYELATDSVSATGKMVGFYTYLLNGAVLESFAVTVP